MKWQTLFNVSIFVAFISFFIATNLQTIEQKTNIDFLFIWNKIKARRANDFDLRLKSLETVKIVELNAAPIIEEPRIKIAIIDTGLNVGDDLKQYLCERALFDLTGNGLQDEHGHGTNIAYLIKKNLDPKKHCLISIKVYINTNNPRTNWTNVQTYAQGVKLALKLNANYINYSSGGYGDYKYERDLMQFSLDKKIRIVVAAGNDHINLTNHCDYYPACYFPNTDNFYVVASMNNDNKLSLFSNYGGPVNVFAAGERQCGNNICLSGTSQATANFTGELAKKENE